MLSRLEHHEDAFHLAVLQELLVATETERGRRRVRQRVIEREIESARARARE